MNDTRTKIPVPGWYTVAAGAAVLFEAFAVYTYFGQVTTDPQGLPIDQRDLVLAMPAWMTVAFAVSVWFGVSGALLLVIRKRLAEILLLVSLIAALAQFGALLFVPRLKNLVASDDLLVPFLIILVSYGIWQLARRANKEGWLR